MIIKKNVLKILVFNLILSCAFLCGAKALNRININKQTNNKFSNKFKDKARPVEFLIIIPSYNNQDYCKKNLKSLRHQDYKHLEAVYINDCSTDHTKILVENYIKKHKLESKIKVINNPKRMGALANIYSVASKCPKNKVIAIFDGDDEFYSPDVFTYLAKIYADKKIWMTYGQFIESNGTLGTCREFPKYVIKQNSFRKYHWITGHLRTFKSRLFHRIKYNDLLYNNEFYPVVCDLATMFPMLEMASKGHIKFIDKILIKYNTLNPLNDHKLDSQLIINFSNFIRSQPAYKPLEKL